MGDAEMVKEFLVESYENLDRLDRDLLELKKDPTARDVLASIFRTLHTIRERRGFWASTSWRPSLTPEKSAEHSAGALLKI